MKIYSEKTGKEYKTVKECQAAETAYDAEKAEESKKKAELAEARKTRAKEIEEAYKVARDAEKHYFELRNAFVKDYGSFHMTFSTPNSSFEDFVNDIFTFL